jgi:ankyrin repeat protein
MKTLSFTILLIALFATQTLAAQKKKTITEYSHTQGEVGLINAVKSCDIQATKLILDMGVNPNFKIDRFSENTPLIESLTTGDFERCGQISVALLNKGADTTAKNRTGYTAMYIAAANVMIPVEMLQSLEKSTSNVSTPHLGNPDMPKGFTPLMELSKQLNGINTLLDRDDRKFCDYATCSIPVKHFTYIAQHGEINHQDSKGNTALHYAVITEASFTMHHLMMAGADPKIKNKKGQTPIGLALATGRSDIIAALTIR